MDNYDLYITFILILKLSFIFLAFAKIYYEIFHKDDILTDKKIIYWKNRVDFVFKISVACLFFYIFNPYHDNTYLIDRETKVLFYLFGIIFIISADWDVFLDMQNDTKF